MTIEDNLLESVGKIAGKPFQKWARDSLSFLFFIQYWLSAHMDSRGGRARVGTRTGGASHILVCVTCDLYCTLWGLGIVSSKKPTRT